MFHRRCKGRNDAPAALTLNPNPSDAADTVLGAASGGLESGWANGVNSVMKSIFRWGKAIRDDDPSGDDDDDMDTCEDMPPAPQPEPQPGPEPGPEPSPSPTPDDDVEALLEGLL